MANDRGGEPRVKRRRQARGRWQVAAVLAMATLTAATLYDISGKQEPIGASAPNQAGGGQPAPSSRSIAAVANPEGDARYPDSMATAELPAGGPFTERGTGQWTIVPGEGPPTGPPVRPSTFTVEVESGVDVPGGPEGFDRMVRNVLAHPKSWIASGQHAFTRVSTPDADIRVSLTSQLTTRDLCGFTIPFEGSCWRPDLRRVVINTARWERGAVVFQGGIVAYQQYVINHEVGHALRFDHRGCPTQDDLAPVMMQQTWGTSNDYLAGLGADGVTADGTSCQPNPWPFPRTG